MSLHHLSPLGNNELARLLIGAAKTIFAASVIALFFPPAGVDRSWVWFLAGVLVAAASGGIGIAILERTAEHEKPQGKRRRSRT